MRFPAVVLFAVSLSINASLYAQGQQAVPDLAEQRLYFAQQPRLLYGCGLILAPWIGEDWSYDARGMDMIKDMGGTHTGANITWFDVEPEQGRWDFRYVDHQVETARERGLELVAYMGMTPEWALPGEARGREGVHHRYPAAEEYEEAFVDYCRTVARRYRGRIRYYRFWNEPNGCSWIKDGCGNADSYPLYTRWLKLWYTAMKAEDPDCVLAAGSIDYHDGVEKGYEYLEGIYREGGKDYFDAFAIHPYVKEGSTALHHRAIRDTRRVLAAHGDWNKPVWILEYAWSTTDETRKAHLIRQALGALNSPTYFYVTVATYLSLSDPAGEPGYGLCERDLTPRPSYHAFKAFPKIRPSRTPASDRRALE
jgi:polysaccharide biosynthesis protein PslG